MKQSQLFSLLTSVYELELDWGDVLPALNLASSDKLRAAVEFPESFLNQLSSSEGPAAQRLLVAIDAQNKKQGLRFNETYNKPFWATSAPNAIA